MKKIIALVFLMFLLASIPKADAAQVTLNWNPPPTNTDGTLYNDPGGYKIYQGTESGHYTMPIDIGLSGCTTSQCTYTVYGLSDQLFYYFAVTAYNAEGRESGFSTEVGIKISGSTPIGTFLYSNVAPGSNGTTEFSLQFIDSSGNPVRITSGSYDSKNWSLINLSTSPNGSGSILWDNKKGTAVVWFIDSVGVKTGYLTYTYDPRYWKPTWFTVNDDRTGRFLWTRPICATPSCTAIRWNTSPSGGVVSYTQYDYGPAWELISISTDSNGSEILFWDNNQGTSLSWLLNSAGTKIDYDTYPYAAGAWIPWNYSMNGNGSGNISWVGACSSNSCPVITWATDRYGTKTGYMQTSYDPNKKKLINYDGR